MAQTFFSSSLLVLCTVTPTLLLSAPQEPQTLPYKQLIILPITLVFGSSHYVPRGTSSSGRPGLRVEVTVEGSSFSWERCNQTCNSQLTVLYPHTHLTCKNEEQRSVSVRQRGEKRQICLHISSVLVSQPVLRSTAGDV